MNGETTKQQQQQQHRRQPKLCIGDLSSGRAFDNNCICFESVNGFRRRECTCNVSSSIDRFCLFNHLLFESNFQAPRLAPVREFMTALINIGKKLPHVPTKEKKSKIQR